MVQGKRMNLILIGFRGCGKSTVGRRAADRLGLRFVDTDELIEKRAHMTIARMFEELGEARFREEEEAVIRSLERERACLIAAGGGAPCSRANRAVLASLGTVVWLRASASAIVERIRGSDRPRLTSLPVEEEVAELLGERCEAYAAAADREIDTDGKQEDEVIHELEHVWRDVQDHDVR
jgi:shikimate dehydrogenase